MRGLIATLPDNHYKIYLVSTENNSHRLVLDVYVRQGRVVDPSDDSEGTRDRPPTEAGEQNQALPLENNPLLEQAPEEVPTEATSEAALPAEPNLQLDESPVSFSEAAVEAAPVTPETLRDCVGPCPWRG